MWLKRGSTTYFLSNKKLIFHFRRVNVMIARPVSYELRNTKGDYFFLDIFFWVSRCFLYSLYFEKERKKSRITNDFILSFEGGQPIWSGLVEQSDKDKHICNSVCFCCRRFLQKKYLSLIASWRLQVKNINFAVKSFIQIYFTCRRLP